MEKIEGIVIKTKDYKEKDKLVWIFTREYGKVTLIANGAKKSVSHLAACTQPLTYGLYMFQLRNGLSTLKSGEVLNNLNGIKRDLYKTASASYLLELVDKSIYDREVQPYVYEWSVQLMHRLDEGEDAEILLRIFEMKMTDVFGVKPNVTGCVQCGRGQNLVGFSTLQGGFLCESCLPVTKDGKAYPISVLKLLYLFSWIAPEQIGNISVRPETKKWLKEIMYHYLDVHTGIFFKSRKFLEELDF